MSNKIKKQFAVVVGNPPYQESRYRSKETKSGNKRGILWDKFIELSIKLCKTEMYISLVHPGQWRKPGHKLLSLIKKYNLLYLEVHDINDGLKTFKVSTGYDWYILQKKEYERKTVIKDLNKLISVFDIKKYNFILNSHLDIMDRIIAKKDEEKCDIVHSYSAYFHQKKYISKTKNNIFKYPIVYGLTQRDGLKLYYSNTNENGHFDTNKVIIPISKYTDAFIDYKGEYGMTQFAFGIKIKDKEEGENIKKAIKSEKFKKVWDACEWIYNTKEHRIFEYFKKDFWKEFI